MILPTLLRTSLVTALAAALVGCDAGSLGGDFVVESGLNDAVSTVVEVSWTTDRPGVSWVEFGTDTSYGHATPLDTTPHTEHDFRLLGMPALTDVYYRAVTEIDGVEYATTGVVSTGNTPPDFPGLSVEVLDADRMSDEPYLLGVATGMSGILFAIDRTGSAVWYLQNDPRVVPEGDVLQSVAVTDGNGLLYGAFTTDFDNVQGVLVHSDALGNVIEKFDAPYAHHQVSELPDGTMTWLSSDIRTWSDGTGTWKVMGDQIVERDADGKVRVVFDTWDWQQPRVHGRWNEAPAGYADWTHANSFSYDESTDTYVLSLGFVSTILVIDRKTGDVVREYGRDGTFVDPESTPFNFQHDVNLTADGHFLMASYNADLSEIFAIEYSIDPTTGILHEEWSHGMGEGLQSFAGGQATRMDNGNVLFGAGTAGILREVTPDGEVVWQMTSDLGQAFCKMTGMWDFYTF